MSHLVLQCEVHPLPRSWGSWGGRMQCEEVRTAAFAQCCASTAAVRCQNECHRLKPMFIPFVVLCGSERGRATGAEPGLGPVAS